jgi:hypothetical protein
MVDLSIEIVDLPEANWHISWDQSCPVAESPEPHGEDRAIVGTRTSGPGDGSFCWISKMDGLYMFILENPMKIAHLGVLFSETLICCVVFST